MLGLMNRISDLTINSWISKRDGTAFKKEVTIFWIIFVFVS